MYLFGFLKQLLTSSLYMETWLSSVKIKEPHHLAAPKTVQGPTAFRIVFTGCHPQNVMVSELRSITERSTRDFESIYIPSMLQDENGYAYIYF